MGPPVPRGRPGARQFLGLSMEDPDRRCGQLFPGWPSASRSTFIFCDLRGTVVCHMNFQVMGAVGCADGALR